MYALPNSLQDLDEELKQKIKLLRSAKVRKLIRRFPDVRNWSIGTTYPRGNDYRKATTLSGTVYLGLVDPEEGDLLPVATGCDASRLMVGMTLIDEMAGEYRVNVTLEAYQALTKDQISILKKIGKIRTEKSVYRSKSQVLVCDVA
jgi:hypothetical protein